MRQLDAIDSASRSDAIVIGVAFPKKIEIVAFQRLSIFIFARAFSRSGNLKQIKIESPKSTDSNQRLLHGRSTGRDVNQNTLVGSLLR